MPGVCLCHKEIDRFPSSSTAPKSEILGLMHADKLKGNFGDWVRKLRDSGKKRGVIVCAIAAKIARIVYRLMKDKVDYTPVPSR